MGYGSILRTLHWLALDQINAWHNRLQSILNLTDFMFRNTASIFHFQLLIPFLQELF